MAASGRTLQAVTQIARVPQWKGYIAAFQPDPKLLDPFIFLVYHDHAFGPGERTGFPAHPHRGFETVTYILEGGFDHGDSKGNKGRYGAGDVQWLTTGKGVLHSEMFVTDPKKPTTFKGFQLWLNLPSRLKMCEPAYEMLWAKSIPKYHSDDGKVEAVVIAGELGAAKAAVQKSTPLAYFHVKVQQGGRFSYPLPRDHNCFIYTLAGWGLYGPQGSQREVGPIHGVVYAQDGDSVEVQNEKPELLEFLLLAGKPFGEPIAHQGPFVMNTREELRQAFVDYQKGLFGYMSDEDDD